MSSVRALWDSICGLLLATAVIFNLLEVALRLLFHSSYDFLIDFSIWLTIWSVLLMAGPILADGEHVSVDFLRAHLRGRPRLAIEIFNVLTTLAYAVAVSISGILLVHQFWTQGAVFPRYFPIPKWLVELCVPLGMSIFTLFAIGEFYRVLRKKW